MPELPEVETFKKYFDNTSLNKTVKDIKIRDNRILKIPEEQFIKEVKGQTFKSTLRHGKYLFVKLNSKYIVFHFGMTGDFEYFNDLNDEPIHSRILFELNNGYYLSYISMRMFGKVDLTNTVKEFLKKKRLGPDGYTMTIEEFKDTLKRRSAIAKTALMDQSIIAGIGNLYSDEILFRTKIHPKTKINLLTDAKLVDLFNNIKEVLKFGIENEGDLSIYPNNFLIPHRVLEEKCPICGTILQRYEISGRHGFFCATCQSLK